MRSIFPLLVISVAMGSVGGQLRRPQNPSPNDACAVADLRKSDVPGLKVYAPDGERYLVNKKDERGIDQIYVGQKESSGLTCITCVDIPNGPKRGRMKMQTQWHPSGRWILAAVERDKYSPPPLLGLVRKYVEGQLQNGLWTNMYAISPDGKNWHRLTDFKSGVKGTADGFTGPAFTPDGKRAVWSQIVDGNVLTYSFGRWELILADLEERNGRLQFTNVRNITPLGMHWNEPGNFHPDGETLLFTGSDQKKDANGMDQYTLNIRTGQVTNLTKSPTVWDEHGVFSPDGEKILFMSAYPYRKDPNSSKILGIKTEFMLMDKDGGNLTQLTHFLEKGYPEYSKKGGIAANGAWSPDGRSLSLLQLYFPVYDHWDLVFQGPCGNRGR